MRAAEGCAPDDLRRTRYSRAGPPPFRGARLSVAGDHTDHVRRPRAARRVRLPPVPRQPLRLRPRKSHRGLVAPAAAGRTRSRRRRRVHAPRPDARRRALSLRPQDAVQPVSAQDSGPDSGGPKSRKSPRPVGLSRRASAPRPLVWRDDLGKLPRMVRAVYVAGPVLEMPGQAPTARKPGGNYRRAFYCGPDWAACRPGTRANLEGDPDPAGRDPGAAHSP